MLTTTVYQKLCTNVPSGWYGMIKLWGIFHSCGLGHWKNSFRWNDPQSMCEWIKHWYA